MSRVSCAAAALAAALVLAAVPAALAEPAPAAPVASGTSAVSVVSGVSAVSVALPLAAQNIDAALAALAAGDLTTARLDYGAYDDAWDTLEDGIRDPHPDAYDSIERDMDRVEDVLLKVDQPDAAQAGQALRALRQTIDVQAPLLG